MKWMFFGVLLVGLIINGCNRGDESREVIPKTQNHGPVISPLFPGEKKILDAVSEAAEKIITTTTSAVPIVDAGKNKYIKEGEVVTLTGVASDLDSEDSSLSYLWSFPDSSGISIANKTSAEATFIAPSVQYTDSFELKLTVTDETGQKGTDTTIITIVNNNANISYDGFTIRNSIVEDNVLGGSKKVGFKVTGGEFVFLRPAAVSEYERSSAKPKMLPFGLWEYKIKGENPKIEIKFPEALVAGSRWYNFSGEVWSEFKTDDGDAATFGSDRMSIVLELKDGGGSDQGKAVADGFVSGVGGLVLLGTTMQTTGGRSQLGGGTLDVDEELESKNLSLINAVDSFNKSSEADSLNAAVRLVAAAIDAKTYHDQRPSKHDLYDLVNTLFGYEGNSKRKELFNKFLQNEVQQLPDCAELGIIRPVRDGGCAKFESVLASLREAPLAYNKPAAMVRGETMEMSLVVDATDVANPSAELKELLEGEIISRTTKTARYMSASLSGAAFMVNPSGEQRKLVTTSSPVKWTWYVTPKTHGEKMLNLDVYAHIEDNGEISLPITVKTFRDRINVSVKFWDRLAGGEKLINMVYMLVAGIVSAVWAFFVWRRNRRNKENNL